MSDRRRMLILICAARSGSKYLRDLLGVSAECAVVPYDINYVWRHGNDSAADDALPPEAAGERQTSYIRQVIPRMAGVRNKRDTRLVVEKTVSNSLRVPFVAQIFPDARYVHLVRDGRAVAESARRIWHEPQSNDYLLDKLRYFPLRNYRYAFWYLRNRLRMATGSSGPTVWGPRYPGIEQDLGSMDLL
ncbi:MAG: sulfotransferase, partial [Steroidobacteraceae bacterium]